MFLDRTFLTGLIVTALGFLLPILLGLAGFEIPIDFLADGVVTYREIIAFIGMLLMAWSDTGQVQLRQVVSKRSAKLYHSHVLSKRRAA